MKLRIATSFAALLILVLATSLHAQAQEPMPPGENLDPIQQLRLTPEQRQRIRMIVQQNQNERQMANRRMREANIALNQALDAERIDETLIEQRINELADAQAANLRIRIQTELKIRRELHPEQLATLRRLRLQMRDVMGADRPNNPQPVRRQGLRPRP